MNSIALIIAAAAMLASGMASAEAPACAPMESEYVALLRQSKPGNEGAIAQRLAAAEADAERGNCNRFLFFGPPESPACPSIKATIQRLQDQLGGNGGSSWFSGPSPEEQTVSLRTQLQENGCAIPSLSASGPGRTLCVRTCDGYYFPLGNRISSSRIKADSAACQSIYDKDGLAALFIQRSDDVADARSVDGKRYGDQSFAFLYRDTFDAACHAELEGGMAALESKAIAAGPQAPVVAVLPVLGDKSGLVAMTESPPAMLANVAQVSPVKAQATGQAALQAISAVQTSEGKPPVRFVGAAYYARMFSYSGE